MDNGPKTRAIKAFLSFLGEIMYKLHVLEENEAILRNKNENIAIFDQDLENKLCSMLHIMEKAGGVGLAAPQIGINQNMFIWAWSGCHEAINPSLTLITNEYWKQKVCIEGCLSIPNEQYTLVRNHAVEMIAYDLSGRKFIHVCQGYEAQILQHEFAHLQGKLICDEGVKNPL